MMKPLFNRRGSALIITVLIIAIIVALTLHFNTIMRSEVYDAYNFQDSVQLGAVARSGFNLALAVLSEDSASSASDTRHEAWARSEDLSSASSSLFEEDQCVLQIKDLTGRIPVNRLVDENGNYNPEQKEVLIRLLRLIGAEIELEGIEDVVDSIKDWIDGDDEVTRFGAEDSYYKGLDPPYACGNGPLESPEELLLIKGITRELFYGTDDFPGISAYLTVYNDADGRININTTDPLVIQALSEDMDRDFIDEIISYRQDEENDLSDPSWYKTALGTNEDILDPEMITTKSTFFEIRSKGMKDAMTKEVVGVIRRDAQALRILSWKML